MELQLWREMLTPYELAVDELVLKFRHIIREYRNVGRYSPIEQVDGRVKSISSILDKMQRKKINVNDVEKELEDIFSTYDFEQIIYFSNYLTFHGETRGEAKGMIEICLDMSFSKEDILKKLQEKLNISLQQAGEYFEMYGKHIV